MNRGALKSGVAALFGRTLAGNGATALQVEVGRVVGFAVAGYEGPVGTDHLRASCARLGISGRYWTDRVGVGTIARVLEELRELGLVTWKRVRPKRQPDGSYRRPARVLTLAGPARLVKAALGAASVALGKAAASLRRFRPVPAVPYTFPTAPTAGEKVAPSGPRPPGEATSGTPPLDLAPLRDWIDRH